MLIDEKIQSIYEEFRCELGIHEKDIVQAQNLHRELLEKNPFRYESPFLISAVCVYAISHNIRQKVSLEDIENIVHIKRDDILKCYKDWDKVLEDLFPLIEDRVQPLFELLSDEVKQEIKAVVSGKKRMLSTKNLYCKPEKSRI